ncbi:MAG TPA: hypothetical protein VGI12_17595 [Vicinamibacterales bacterium]
MTERQAPRLFAWLLWLALAGLCVAALGPSYINHDAAWYLYMVERWRDGATLYRDVIDTNPPLIIWLSAPPVLAARALGVPHPALFKVYVLLLAAWSCAIALRAIRRSWPALTFPVFSAVVFAALPFVKQDFGQREHLALLLTLPYLFMAASDARAPAWERLTTGVGAGLGFAIKPHFLAAWLVVEVAALVARGARSWIRMELVAAAATIAAYGVAVLVFVPQYLPVLAEVREVYGGLNAPVSALIRLPEVQIWIGAAALAASFRWGRDGRLPLMLFAAATGFVLAALLQMKGWSYHLYPARALLLLFFVAATSVILDRAPQFVALLRGGLTGLATVFAAVLAVSSARYVLEARHPAAPDLVTPLVDAIRRDAPEGPLAVLSTATFVYPAFPAVNYTHARWGLRQNSVLFLEALYAGEEGPGGVAPPHPVAAMRPTERALFHELTDDLCRTPPRLLLVDAVDPRSRSTRRTFDVVAYVRQDARVAALLEHYRAQETIGRFSVLVPDGPLECR